MSDPQIDRSPTMLTRSALPRASATRTAGAPTARITPPRPGTTETTRWTDASCICNRHGSATSLASPRVWNRSSPSSRSMRSTRCTVRRPSIGALNRMTSPRRTCSRPMGAASTTSPRSIAGVIEPVSTVRTLQCPTRVPKAKTTQPTIATATSRLAIRVTRRRARCARRDGRSGRTTRTIPEPLDGSGMVPAPAGSVCGCVVTAWEPLDQRFDAARCWPTKR